MTAIFPGSFDPVTFGHLDIAERAAKLTDRLIMAVTVNSAKKGLFSPEERVELLKQTTAHLPNIEIKYFSGLLVDFAKKEQATVIIKGIRNYADFEYEQLMARINSRLSQEIETLILYSRQEHLHISSGAVREMVRLGAEIDFMVPQCVKVAITEKIANIKYIQRDI